MYNWPALLVQPAAAGDRCISLPKTRHTFIPPALPYSILLFLLDLLREERGARAEAELDELRALVLEAVEQARAVERMLTKRGYTSAKVRRWIALECGVVLPRRDP